MSNTMGPRHLALQAALTRAVTPAGPRGAMEAFWAVIVAVTAGPPASVDVAIGGSTVTVSGLRYDKSLTPAAGQTVWGFRVGKDYFVVGARA